MSTRENKQYDKDKRNQDHWLVCRSSSSFMVLMAGCIKKEMIKQSLRGKGVNHEDRRGMKNVKLKVQIR